jgi:hypothetical protein
MQRRHADAQLPRIIGNNVFYQGPVGVGMLVLMAARHIHQERVIGEVPGQVDDSAGQTKSNVYYFASPAANLGAKNTLSAAQRISENRA